MIPEFLADLKNAFKNRYKAYKANKQEAFMDYAELTAFQKYNFEVLVVFDGVSEYAKEKAFYLQEAFVSRGCGVEVRKVKKGVKKVVKRASSCQCVAVVCHEQMFKNRALVESLVAVTSRGVRVCAFLPELNDNNWSIEDYFHKAPSELKHLFDEKQSFIFRFSKYFYEEDEQIAKLYHAVNAP